MNGYTLRAAGLMALLTAACPLFAGGQSESFPGEPVKGKTHWSHSVNLSEMEEGKYNIIIEATDEAGNVRMEGPYDFFIDQKTDIPSVSVAHPQPGARVGRMLPIIGTARDDDRIARVLVSLNNGPWRPASGGESWSAMADAAALGDGPQYLAVKSVDEGGLESPVVTVPFLVDTSSPSGGVTDPVSGARISGKSEFSGRMSDPNGIESIEISKDGAETWDKLKFSREKETGDALFKVTLDSRKLDDGPLVWWLRAVDKQGSSSSVPFLFFVDNKGPEISLEYPAAGKEGGIPPVPGNVFLAGTAEDQSGIASLQLLQGKNEPVDIPVIPGNPWWYVSLNLSGRKDKKANFVLRAVDGAGNASEIKLTVPLDTEADKPLLTVDDQAESGSRTFAKGKAYLTGVFSDDDGMGAILWKAGELSGKLENVERAWRLDLPDLPVGTADLELVPEDGFGLKGVPVKLRFRVAPPAPRLSLDYLKDNDAEDFIPWTPGAVVSSSGASIAGSVSSEVVKDVKLTCTFSGEEAVSLSLKTDPEDPLRRLFQIPVKKGTESGQKVFTLRAEDPFGGESVLGSGFFVQGLPDESGTVPDPRRGSAAVTLAMPDLREKDGAGILRADQPLQGWTSGASVSGARLEPASPLLVLRGKGNSFLIESLAPGISEPVKVVLSDGSSSRPVRIVTDLEAPRWEIDTPVSGFWSNGSVPMSGTVVDEGGLRSLSWSVKGGRSTALDFEEKGKGRYTFRGTAELSRLTDGEKILIFSAEDLAGNISEYELPFILDTRPPAPVMVVPPGNYSSGALNTLIYDVQGRESLEEVSLTVDGKDRINAEMDSLYALNLNLADYDAIPETLSVRFVDRAGNSSEVVPSLVYDPVSDKPLTMLQTPVDNSVARGPTDISGIVVDDDAIAAVYWRINGSEWNKLPGDASFQTDLPLDSLADGAHFLEAYAEDAAGNAGETDSVWFSVSRQEPEVFLSSLELGDTQRGVVAITGTASDANGIREVWISVDNGTSFFKAEGASEFEEEPAPDNSDNTGAQEVKAPRILDKTVMWNYSLDTRILDDGVRTLLVKVVDGAGDEAVLAGILETDNTKPLLNVGNPAEGSIHIGNMVVEGRVADAGGLAGFHVLVEQNGKTVFEYSDPAEGVFHIPFDFSGIEAGKALLLIEAEDLAGNVSTITRDFTIQPGRRTVVGEILLPVEGAQEGPFFKMAGFVDNAVESDKVVLVVDEEREVKLDLDRWGRFSREFSPGELNEGVHRFRVDIISAAGERITGSVRQFHYREGGQWVIIDGYNPMAAIASRPLLEGRCGFYIPPPEAAGSEEESKSKKFKEKIRVFENLLKKNRPLKVEVSVDGGLSFEKARGRSAWSYRIETGELREATLPIVVRAQFPEGWAYTRTAVRLDKTLPDVKLNESIADGRFNGNLDLSGTAKDERTLGDVVAILRPGSLNQYEVPSFVQGMYFDTSVMGATWFNSGLGVTFFDENVKFQLNAGWAPDEVWSMKEKKMLPARVSGTALGGTILANVAYLPLGYYWGPKWENFSVSFALGANFTYFTHFTQSGGGVMSAVVGQIEIPKITFSDRRFFTYLSPYIDLRVWMFSSDVNTKPYFTGSLGLRLGLL